MIVDIKGHQIKFPFEPYPLQRDYMEKVLEALDNQQNAVLESPTGKFSLSKSYSGANS
jgi:regulator of telomere elongation helicase 1